MHGSTVSTGKIVTIKPKKEKVNRSKSEKIIIWVVFALLAIYAFTLIYPFIYLIINSMKTIGEFLTNPMGLPKNFTAMVNNYSYVFAEYPIISMFINSVALSVGQTVVGMALSCIAAYVLAKYKFKGNGFIYMATIIASMVPTVGATPATYKLMINMGFLKGGYLYNYLGMLFMIGAFGGPFLYLHSFFKAIPWSYGESAQLDGASDFRIFVQIMLPLAANGVLTFTIIRFLGSWNEYWSAYLYFGRFETLAVGLNRLSTEAASFNLHVELFAAMIVSIIPVLIFYAIFQKQLMRNTIGGGLKG
ncbi:MAG: carbohydrate ABC transporter permease [Clostridiales bacterium]|nr:carbohydrate ABC transporter permease [Clostridiales bacterium]